MKRNEQKKQINIISQHMSSQNFLVKEIHKTDKMFLTNKKGKDIEKKLFKSLAEKIKNNQNTNNNSNSQLLLNRSKKEKSPIRIPNINLIRSKEEPKINKNNFRLTKNLLLNKSQSINNLKNKFPIINSKSKNKFNDKDKDKEKEKAKYEELKQFPKTKINFFHNYQSSRTNMISVKNSNNSIDNKDNCNNINNKQYKFIVRPENCGYLIVRCFRHRKNWKEIKNDYNNQSFNFKWQQNTKNILYASLSKLNGLKQMVNHFEFHSSLSNKANLFYNMMKYAEQIEENVFKYIPFTILLDYNSPNFFMKMENFQNLFNNIEKYIVKYEDINDNKYKHSRQRIYSYLFPYIKMVGNKTAINIQESHLFIPDEDLIEKEEKTENKKEKEKGKKEEKEDKKDNNKGKTKKIYNNLWILKAPNLNRGMCIKIINDINLMEKCIRYYNRGISLGYNDNNLNNTKFSLNDNEKEEITNCNIYQSNTIIIQKYIENPLLYFGRKFDIRVWVLLSHDLKVYVFNEGHLKCCSVKYDLSSNDIYSHITNYSFQKYNDNFGKYELGNEVSYDDLQTNIDAFYNRQVDFKRDILPKIYDIIKFCFQSVRTKINSMNRKYTFEIFGFDFMIDCNFEPFLIEINTNPGLEESSPLIKMLIPRMLDDALRLTVDKEFETIYNFNGIELNSSDENSDSLYRSPFPVNGYSNSENIFKLVCDLNEYEKVRKLSFRKCYINTRVSKLKNYS